MVRNLVLFSILSILLVVVYFTQEKKDIAKVEQEKQQAQLFDAKR